MGHKFSRSSVEPTARNARKSVKRKEGSATVSQFRVIETDGVRITIRPMLTTSQKNFKNINDCTSVLASNYRQTCTDINIQRKDIELGAGSRCFLLHGLLTREECQFYIEETERVGYSSLSDLFDSEYRSNDRLLSISEELAEGLYRRLEPYLERRDIVRIRPVGFGNEGTWKPHRLNECFKFGKYRAGGHFSPHLDGPWVPREDESSVYTMVIYLNDDYEGGKTNFLSPGNDHILSSVSPQQGTALVFNHDTLHEGMEVISGTKYIMRTEIMFHRVDTDMLPDPMVYKLNKSYTEALSLYVKSHDLEHAGDTKGFTDSYLEALRLQVEAQRSVGVDAEELMSWCLPYELYLHVFSYLSPSDLTRCMRVCKGWYDVAMDGQLWMKLFQMCWPMAVPVEKMMESGRHKTPGAFTKDWYGCYKQRAINAKQFRAVVYDLGSHTVKCGIMTRKTQKPVFFKRESIVAQVHGIFDIHLRREQFERYYSGAEARKQFPDHLVRLVENGVLPEKAIQLLPEIMLPFYLECSLKPKYYPIVVLEPAYGWDDKTKEKLANCLMSVFHPPALCFLNATIAILYSHGLSCGVVVNLGHETASVSAVWDGDIVNHATEVLKVKSTPLEIAHVVGRVLETSCGGNDKKKSIFKQNVVLAGGHFMAKRRMVSKVEAAIDKIVGACCHRISGNEDKMMSAVSGGCSFVSSLCFTQYMAKKGMKCPVEQEEWYNLAHPLSFYRYVIGWHGDPIWSHLAKAKLLKSHKVKGSLDIADSDDSD